MGILKMKEVKHIVKGHGKQASKDFLTTLDDYTRRKIDRMVSSSRSKRLTDIDVTYYGGGGQ